MSSKANEKERSKYRSKLDRVVNILMSMEVPYENWREQIYTSASPDKSLATQKAIEILSLFGINKPKDLLL